jgi:hypothetical protein
VGLFSKKAPPIEQAIDAALNAVAMGARNGLEVVTVQVKDLPVGHGRLDQTIGTVIEALQRAGHSVVGVEQPDWSYRGFLQVKPAAVAGGSGTGATGADLPLSEAIKAAVVRYRVWFSNPSDIGKIWSDRDALEKRILDERPKAGAGLDAFNADLGADWFWVNAFPAFAGLQLGQRETRSGFSVFQFAGDADASCDRANPHAAGLMSAIDERARNSF